MPQWPDARLDDAISVLFWTTQKKTSPNSRRHRTSLPVSLPVLLNLAVHVLSSSSSIGSPSNTALTSKQPTTPYIGLLFILPNRLTYVHPCMPVFPLVPSDSPTLIFSVLFVRTAFGARSSALQPLQEAQLSPRDRAMRRVSWNLASCNAAAIWTHGPSAPESSTLTTRLPSPQLMYCKEIFNHWP